MQIPILLVHGYLNFSSVWWYFLHKLSKKNSSPIYTLNLKNPFRSIEEYAQVVQKKALEIEKKHDESKLILIGHSMGGLVCLTYAAFFAKKQSVKKIITLGSPLQGTIIANIAIGKCGKQMRCHSSFLQKIHKENFKGVHIYQIAAKKDELIIPYNHAFFWEKNRYLVDNIGHMELLFSSKIIKKVLSILAQ